MKKIIDTKFIAVGIPLVDGALGDVGTAVPAVVLEDKLRGHYQSGWDLFETHYMGTSALGAGKVINMFIVLVKYKESVITKQKKKDTK